jgi:hypothetical protein
MSQDVSVRKNRMSGLRPGFAYHRRRGRHIGDSELQVHPVRALLGLNDHLHRPAGSPLTGLSDFAVNEMRRAYVCVGRHLGANQRLSKRSPMTGRIFDEIERQF